MMEKRKAVVVEDDSTSTTTAGLTGCKKPRLAAGKEPVAVAAVEMSDVYRSGDFQGRIADCWRCAVAHPSTIILYYSYIVS